MKWLCYFVLKALEVLCGFSVSVSATLNIKYTWGLLSNYCNYNLWVKHVGVSLFDSCSYNCTPTIQQQLPTALPCGLTLSPPPPQHSAKTLYLPHPYRKYPHHHILVNLYSDERRGREEGWRALEGCSPQKQFLQWACKHQY